MAEKDDGARSDLMTAVHEHYLSTALIGLNVGLGFVGFGIGLQRGTTVAIAGAILLASAAALATWRGIAHGA